MASEDSLDIRKEWANFKKIISQNRYKELRSTAYVFDRVIFNVAMVLILGWLVFVAYWYHFDLDYYKCEHGSGMAEVYMGAGGLGEQKNIYSDDWCKNPFYRPESWKNQEYLPPGEYGTILGPMFHSAWLVAILGLAGAGGLNHLIHNRHPKKKKRRKRT